MNSPLIAFTKIAQKVIYNPERFKQLLKMMRTKEGAVQAAMAVVAGIDKIKQIPAEIMPQVAVHCYLLMVDVAQEATGAKPDNAILAEVVKAILAQAAPQEAAPPGNVMEAIGAGGAA